MRNPIAALAFAALTAGLALTFGAGTAAADTTPPTLTSAAVNGSTLTLTFDETLAAADTTSQGLGIRFSVKGFKKTSEFHNGLVPDRITISGATVTLNMAIEYVGGRDVTVIYNRHSSHNYAAVTKLRDADGNEVESFRQVVTNNSPVPAGPWVESAKVAGTALTLTFNRAMADSETAGSAFRVDTLGRDDGGRSIRGTGTASISGANVRVALASAVDEYDIAWVAYRKPAANPLRDTGDNDAGSFSSVRLTVLDAVPPRLVGGSIDGSSVALHFSEPLDDTGTPGAGQFTVTAGTTDLGAVTNVDVDGSSITMTTATAATAGQAVTVSLSGTSGIRDVAGNEATAPAAAVGLANLLDPDPGAPALAATDPVAVDGAILTLTYDKNLDASSVPEPDSFKLDEEIRAFTNVGIDGARVTLVLNNPVYPCTRARFGADPYVLSYDPAKAGSPLQNLHGTDAAAFTDKAVANTRTCVTSEVSGRASASGGKMALGFDRRLDRSAPPDATHFAVAGISAAAVKSATIPAADDRAVELTLSRALAASETATVSYTRPHDAAGLRDADGNQLADFSLQVASRPPLTASFHGLPVAHDGAKRFGFEVRFGEDVPGLTLMAVERALTVTGGRLIDVKRTVRGRNDSVTVRVRPAGDGDMTIALAATTDCVASGAICGRGWRKLASVLAAVPGPGNGLTAEFTGLPAAHDGAKRFEFELRFAEEIAGLKLRTVEDALQVTGGKAVAVKRAVAGEIRRITVQVRPDGVDDVTVALPAATDCSASGALCAPDGRKLVSALTATVRGPVAISVADARASEGSDAAVEFAATLNRAASVTVTVDYATRDGTAAAGEDYTFTRGTLSFAAGELEKTVSVPILDDAVDEGEEIFTLKLTNPRGAAIGDGEATGTIENSDPLQTMWLSRFGRAVAGHVADAVSDRLAKPLTGAQVTVGGQTVDLAETDDAAFLGRTLTSLARVMGAPQRPAPAGDGWPGSGSPATESGPGGWPETDLGFRKSPHLAGAPMRDLSDRELLLGSTFHLAMEGDGAGPGFAAWGRVTVGGFDGEAPADAGNVSIDGNVTTGVLGADAEWKRLLAGVAVSMSEGEGTFNQPGVDSGTIESSMTTVSPYARVGVTDRISVWGLAGWSTGEMTIVQAANDRGQPERTTQADLAMRLVALGGRGALIEADESSGIDLALKGDAFWMETESEPVSNEGTTAANASRVRFALEGSRAFATGGGTLTPGLELGLRHDGGDAETGTGVELGGRVSWTDPETGLGVEARTRALIAHETSDYGEWGASGAVRLAPGERGRGLSFSLSPSWGTASSGVGRLWGVGDARGLAADQVFEAEQRLEGELGYGLGLFGDRLTGTPNTGFGLSDTARELRIGWRLTSVVPGDPGFAVTLDARRREAANGDEPPEHGVMLRGAVRW